MAIKKRVGNDYFQYLGWQLVMLLEQISGFWPYQSQLQQYPLQLIHFVILLAFLLAEGNQFRQTFGIDATATIDCGLLMIFEFTLIVTLMFASITQYKRKRIYEQIVKHFKNIIDPEEAAVLEEFVNQGLIYAGIYILIGGFGIFLINALPTFRDFYEYFILNQKLIFEFPLPMDYGFDHKKYWYAIVLHFVSAFCSAAAVLCAFDLSFILQIRHVQSLFKIVKMRLTRASDAAMDFEINDDSYDVSNSTSGKSYSIISSAIDLHCDCFEVIGMIEETYSLYWLVVLLLNSGAFAATVHTVFSKNHDSVDTLRCICGFAMILMHFFVVFSQGQAIIDCNSSIIDLCYDCKWYGLPKNSCKLLISMMMRASMSCELTGGKLFLLNMETFSSMFKGGLSYYTVFEN